MIRPQNDEATEVESSYQEAPKLEQYSGTSNPCEGLNALSVDRGQPPSLGISKEALPADDDEEEDDEDEIDLSEWARRAIRAIDPSMLETRHRAILFEHLYVYGSDSTLRVQHTVLSALWYPISQIATLCRGPGSSRRRHTILYGFDGLLQNGELLLVLGRPGSGCSTFLKALCGQLGGLDLDPTSKIQYKGISAEKMKTEFRGDLVYNSEADQHFPHLTVGETLTFAAHARAPHNLLGGMSRDQYVKYAVRVAMAFFGLSHAYNSKVGDDYVRGVSGGERKRVRLVTPRHIVP